MRSAIRTGTGLVIKLPFRLGERLRTFDRAGDAMTTFAELVEAPADWYAELPSSYRDKLRGDPGYMRDLIYQERRRRVLTGAAPASVGPSTPELPWWVRPFSPRRVSREVETTFMDHCFDELHELLCSDSEKYAADRKVDPFRIQGWPCHACGGSYRKYGAVPWEHDRSAPCGRGNRPNHDWARWLEGMVCNADGAQAGSKKRGGS